ncbi:hypothetical protein BVU17_02355 [Haloarcula taiwanensis]|uniref:Uncharacterized protein n=1 Tax=Haloarcula taiwanensis TaxID=1932004 RepID=A0A2H4ZVB8_9EURY|nr:hypothetical protein [Haloarcula taiwanensis]AUG46418.1 hypothetical protein BVU17_02355 [Haloarcula taiwanensis]
MSGANTRPGKTVYLGSEMFDFKSYQPGSEGIVATTKVPSTQVWKVPVGMPLVVALVGKQTATAAGGDTTTVDLTPEAPIVDYMDDVTAGEYTTDASLIGYFDSDGDGDPDTLITDSTDTQYTGTFGTDGDFVASAELKETTGNGDVSVAFYAVMRHGLTKIQKRNSGKGNVSQELQSEDSITWAFSNPDSPETDRQITWDGRNSGMRGVLPPKFNMDLLFFDTEFATAVEAADAENVEVSIPVNQRPLRPDEEAAELRRKVTQTMVA